MVGGGGSGGSGGTRVTTEFVDIFKRNNIYIHMICIYIYTYIYIFGDRLNRDNTYVLLIIHTSFSFDRCDIYSWSTVQKKWRLPKARSFFLSYVSFDNKNGKLFLFFFLSFFLFVFFSFLQYIWKKIGYYS